MLTHPDNKSEFQAAAGNAENVKDDLNGLDKAVSAVLGQRTIERNQLLVSIAKSKFTKNRDDKGEKITKPEELVRLYDLLIQVLCDLKFANQLFKIVFVYTYSLICGSYFLFVSIFFYLAEFN